MTAPAAVAAAVSESEVRWLAWQARGSESDRRTTMMMRVLLVLVVLALIIFWSVPLVTG